jgi:hypothetical protein
MKQPTYSKIENPYDNTMVRTAQQVQTATPQSIPVSTEAQKTVVRSEQNLTDIWIDTFIRSKNWSPQKTGFYINGRTGYAEFSNVVITSALQATAGVFGGFQIGADYIRDLGNTFGLSSTETVANDVRFWSGSTFAARDTAPFRVYESGAIIADNITVSGASQVDSGALTGTVSQNNLAISNKEWITTCSFSSASYNSGAWSAGILYFSDGTTYSITAGSVSGITTTNYIYFDPSVSTTVFQVTTNPVTSLSSSKACIATFKNNLIGDPNASYQVFNAAGGVGIKVPNVPLSQVTLNGATSGSITIASADVSTPHTMKLPAVQGTIGQILTAGALGTTNWGNMPTIPTVYDGYVSGGAPVLPSGWSLSSSGTGVFTVTHNLSSLTYKAPVVSAVFTSALKHVNLTSKTANDFEVNTYDSAGVLEDVDFSFILVL